MKKRAIGAAVLSTVTVAALAFGHIHQQMLKQLKA